MKLIKYQITERKYMEVKVCEPNHIQTIQTLNKMFYQSKRKDLYYKRHVVSIDKLKEFGYEPKDNDFLEKVNLNKIFESLYRAINSLSIKQKIVIIYVYFLDYKLLDLAMLLDTSIQNVFQIEKRALKKLKHILLKKYKLF